MLYRHARELAVARLDGTDDEAGHAREGGARRDHARRRRHAYDDALRYAAPRRDEAFTASASTTRASDAAQFSESDVTRRLQAARWTSTFPRCAP
jgi:hypothetical protein